MEEDVHSFVVQISKPKLYAKDSPHTKKYETRRKLCYLHKPVRTPTDITLKNYTLANEKPLKGKMNKKEELVLPYKFYSKREEKNNKKQRLKVNIDSTYKFISTDLRSRLHVDILYDDIKAVTDIDKDFFRYVNGRTLAHKNIAVFKSFKFFINDQVRIRQEVGYRNDCILHIESVHRREIKKYNETVHRYMSQVKNLDSFISEDFQNSMSCLENWEMLKHNVEGKKRELYKLAAEKFTIISRLIGLDYRYDVQQKYGRFLYYLSPPTWRSNNREFARSIEIEAKGFDFGSSGEDDTFNVVFEKLKKECNEDYVKPVIYFTQPRDLMSVFESIEERQLLHFTHVTRLTPYANMLKEGIKVLKDNIFVETADVRNYIKDFQSTLGFCEERCSQLQASFFKILNGLFYESVGAPEVLKLDLHLDFCYERIHNERPMNMDIVGKAKALEEFYMLYTKRLEDIRSHAIQKAVKQCIEYEERKIRKAHRASRELRLFDRLERDLLRACAPLPKHGFKMVPKRVKPPVCKKMPCKIVKLDVKSKGKREITDAEREYLTLFTDWVEDEDPAHYMLSLNTGEG